MAHSHEAPIVQSVQSPLARSNALTLVVGFALLILIGTLLLRLPIAGTERSLTWIEAFFTSTSAVTVTGLNVITPAHDLSLFGQIVVLLLIEIGGVGFIAFSVLLFALIGRRLGFAERLLLRQSLGVFHLVGIGRLTVTVFGGAVVIQLVGALLLWLRWWPALGAGPAAYQALFHSVSAFCNAGFDLFSGVDDVLFGFGSDPFTLVVLMALIVIGGLGLLVITDLLSWPWDRRLMVYTKLILIISVVLTVIGVIIVLTDDALANMAPGVLSQGDHFWVGWFTVVSARTAGLTIIPIDQLGEASILILIVSMFVGGAPASMGGGVTMSTVAVLIVAVIATVRGRPQAVAFGRTLPLETISKAVAIMTVSTLLCFIITLALLLRDAGDSLPVVFEVVSAFSNTGYSMSLTPNLDTIGRILIAFTMFWGRLGPLTLVVLLAQSERRSMALYPSEQIVIG
jgi:trk system potassium uptake protein TrkH